MKEYKLSGGEALARAVEKRYETVASEYHFEPLNLHDDGGEPVGTVKPGDGVIFCCRRGERETELTDAFTDPDFKGFSRNRIDPLDFVILTMYSEKYTYLPIAFAPSKVEKTLAQVPAEKVILGVPFFTRVWKGTGAKPDSSLLNMNATDELLAQYGVQPAWDAATGQNYAEFAMGTVRARVWIEDAESMAARLGAVRSSKLAGLAAWRLGMETPDIWTVFERYFSGADLSQAAGP